MKRVTTAQRILAGVVGILLVGGAIAFVVLSAAGNGGPPNSSAAKLPPVPTLIPLNTLTARVLAQKTPPPIFQTVLAQMTADARSPRPVTRMPALYSNTATDAIRLAANEMNGNAGDLLYANATSVSYVATTLGRALALFDPTRSLGSPANTPVWAFVAYGGFRPRNYGCESGFASCPTPPLFSSMWAVVVKGSYDEVLSGVPGKNLSTLGSPVINIPLAQWPNRLTPLLSATATATP